MLGSLLFLVIEELWLMIVAPTTYHLAFLWAYIVPYNFFTTKMLAPVPPPEHIIPFVGVIASNSWCTCQNHQFGCGDVLS